MNPMVAFRKKLGLSVCDFAIAAGVNYSIVWNLEHGLTANVPLSIMNAVNKIGYDADKLADDYLRWRSESQKRILTRLAVS